MVLGDLEIRLRADIARLASDMTQARRIVGDATTSMSRAADMAKSALAGIAAGMGLSQLVQMSDAYAKFTAQLKLASVSAREYAAAYADVKRIATASQQGLGETGVLYARIANGTRELGTSQKQVAAITEVVNMSLKVSGATANEAASAQLQLSQAFASGTLRGEEFNAANEAAPRLMLALADGMGVPVGKLKEMAGEGRITSKIMADVLPNALAKLRVEAAQVQTIGGAFTVLKNNVMELIGVQANASGAVAGLTSAIGLLSSNLAGVAWAMSTMIAIKATNWLSTLVTDAYAAAAAKRALAAATLQTAVTTTEAAAVAAAAKLTEAQANVRAAASSATLTAARVTELRAAVLAAEGATALAITTNGLIPAQVRAAAAAEAHALALAAQAVSAGGATTASIANTAAITAQAGAASLATRAMGLLRGGLALIGGPIGAVILALSAGALAWLNWGSKAKEGNDLAKESAIEASDTIIAELDKQIERNNRIIQLRKEGATLEQASRKERQVAALERLEGELGKINLRVGATGGMSSRDDSSERAKILEKILELKTKISLTESTGVAANELTQGEARLKFMKEFATRQEQMNAKLDEARKLLGTAFTADDEARIRKSFADNGAAAAVKKEATAYENLITAIKAKTAENNTELATGRAATENQKFAIKLHQEEARSKKNLSSADLARVASLKSEAAAQLAANKTSEDAVKAMQAEKDVAKYIDESTIAREESAAALAVEYKMFGKSADARSLAMAAIKEQTALEKFLLQEKADGKIVTEEELVMLKAEAAARTKVEQATLAQGKALSYAAQLEEENQKFAAESIFDEKDRYAASLKREAKMWRERIALAGEGTEAQKIVQEKYSTWYENQLLKPQLEAEKAMWTSVENTAHDTFISIFDSGKSAFDRLRDALKNGLLDLLYQMTVKKWVVNIAASTSGVGIAGAAEASTGDSAGGMNLGSIAGMASAAKAAYGAISTGFAGIATSVTNSVNAGINSISATSAIYGPTASGGNIAATSPYASAAGTVAGYAAGAAVGVFGGRAISNGYAVSGSGNGLVNIGTVVGAILGAGPMGAAIGGIIGGTVNRLFGRKPREYGDSTMTGTFGADGFSGSTNTPWVEKGGLFRSSKRDTDKVAIDPTAAAAFTAGYDALKTASIDFASVLGIQAEAVKTRAQSLSIVLTKDQAANEKLVADFFVGVGDSIAQELLPTWAEFKKEGESAGATFQRLAGDYAFIDAALNAVGDTFGAVGVGSIAARERLLKLSGGLEAFGTKAAFFAQNYLTEAERLAPVAKSVDAAFASLEMAVPKTRQEFKNLVMGLDLATEAGSKTYAGLMNVQEAFAQLTPAVRSLVDIASEGKALQAQYDALTMDPAALKQKQRAEAANAVDPSNRIWFDRVQDAQTASDKNAVDFSAAAKLAEVNKGYQDQIDTFVRSTMSAVEVRALDIKGMDASTVALYDLLEGHKVSAKNRSVELEIMELTGDKAGALAAARAAELVGLDASTVAVIRYRNALQDQATASATAIAGANTAFGALKDSVAKSKADMDALYQDHVANLKASADAAKVQIDEVNKRADAVQGVFDKLNKALESTVIETKYFDTAQRRSAQELLARAAITTRGGGVADIKGLDEALGVIAKPSQQLFGSFEEWARDQARTGADIAALKTNAKAEIDFAALTVQGINDTTRAIQAGSEAQLQMLADQHKADMAKQDAIIEKAEIELNLTLGLNTGILSVIDALKAFNSALTVVKETPSALSVEGLFQQVLGRKGQQGGIDFWKGAYGDSVDGAELADFIKASKPELDAKRNGTLSQFLREHGVPGYATGGDFGGGLRLVGENGPELEATGPSRIFNADQTRSMMSGGGNAEMVAELRELRREVSELRAPMERTAASTDKAATSSDQLAKQFGNVSSGGNVVRVKVMQT